MKKVLLKFSCLFFVLLLITTITKAESIPVITKQPSDVTAYYNSTFPLSIEITGTNIQYQWQMTNDSGAWIDNFGSTSSTYLGYILSYTAAQPKYRCKVSNAAGVLYSREVKVTAICQTIKFTTQPPNSTFKEGQTAIFTVNVAEGANQYVEWYINGAYASSTPVQNNLATLTLPDVQMQLNGAKIYGKINWTCKDAIYSVQSSVATLTITTDPLAPKITKQLPVGDTIVSGTPLTLTIEATGSNLTYQWWARQGRRPALDDQAYVKVGTGKSYTFTPIFTNCTQELYDIYVVVSNSYGSPKSIVSTIQVLPTLPVIKKQPVNLTVKEGDRATFTAETSSTLEATIFNWYKNGVKVKTDYKCCTQLAASTYSFSATSADKDANVYCEIYSSGNYGRCSSESAVVKTKVAKVNIINNDNISDCFVENIPNSKDWSLRNDWKDQTLGSYVANDAKGLRIHHRATGQDYFWVIDKNQVNVVKGKEYTFYFDVDASAMKIDFALSETFNNRGPVNYTLTPVKIAESLYGGTFGHYEVSFIANVSGYANIGLMFSLYGLPTSATEYFIKNVRLCETVGNTSTIASTSRLSNETQAISPSETIEEEIVVYPNPSNGKLSINFKATSSDRKLIIRDKTGTILAHKEIINKENAIDLGNVAPGIYLIQVSSSEGNFSKTIIVN